MSQTVIAPVAAVAAVAAPVRILGITVATVQNAGSVFALLDGANDALVECYIGLLGSADVSYDAWEAARMGWREGYATQKEGASANALDKAWSRFAASLAERGAFKPAAPTKAAAEKRKERAAAPVYESADNARSVAQSLAKVAAMPADERAAFITDKKLSMATDITPAELTTAATKAWKAAEKMDKAAEREKTKAADSALKARRETIRAFVKDAAADKLAALEALCDALNGNAAAWSVIRAILPAEKMADAMSEAKAKRAA